MKPDDNLAALLRKFDSAAPRYTSYPPIPFWGDVNAQTVRGWMAQPTSDADHSISLYVHIPFCKTRCYYCGCFVIISGKQEPAEAYMKGVHKEMTLVRESLAEARPVRQFHLGGGTPTFINAQAMGDLVAHAKSLFPFEDDAEMSIEVDPRTVDVAYLTKLREMGFNRISLGVQDFDEKVQQEVNRIQPKVIVQRMTEAARDLGFFSINYDLIYGLPHQTLPSFTHTLEQVIELKPGRIALYNFAFLPDAIPYQRRFDPTTLPDPEEKLAIFLTAKEKLTESGYQYIGLDHFALGDDELAQAWRAGTMRRNFMGYTTQAGTDMLAFGVSAISDYQGQFWQNEKKLNRYLEVLESGELPVTRGMALDSEDLLRQNIISSLFCAGGFRFDELGNGEFPDLSTHLAWEMDALAPLAEDGLVKLNGEGVEVTPLGQLFLRNIAVIFDNHIRARNTGEQATRFSRTV